jgi:EmrB/QacA subfamily drug resistance transporter
VSSERGLPYKWAVMLCLLPALTIVTLDLTIVNVALAKLGMVFGVNVASIGWVITAFALAMGVVTPMAAYVENRLTMKRAWVGAVALFTIGSVLCGVAPAFSVLIVGRLLQGVAGGVLLPMAISTLFGAFPEGERGGAFGLMAIPIIAGPAFGPTLGGYIVTHLDWRTVFFVNLPIGLLAVVAAVVLLRPSRPRPARFDAVGAVLSSVAFSSIIYGVTLVSEDGLGALLVQSILALGVLSLIAFCAYELTRDEPLLEIRLFALPQFLISNIVFWVGNVALLGTEFMMPLYLQSVRGLSALDTGLLLMPQGFAVALSAPLAGRLVDRVGPRLVAAVGFGLLTLNTWQLSHITLDTSFDTVRWLLVMRGLAFGCAIAPPSLVALAVVPERLRTNASSLNKGSQSVFQSLGVALLATLVQAQSVAHRAVLSWQVRPGSSEGGFLDHISALLQVNAGLTPAAGNVAAVTAVLSQVARQAAVLAFADAYRVTFTVALLALLVAMLLPGRGQVAADQSALLAG